MAENAQYELEYEPDAIVGASGVRTELKANGITRRHRSPTGRLTGARERTTLCPMRTTFRRIGNAQGVIIPKSILAQLGLDRDVELDVEGDAIVLRKPKNDVRAGWADAARQIAADGSPEELRYRLKITLRDVEPKVWRRIEVLGDTTLPRLHRMIQIAMGWDDSHLHAFKVAGTTYGTPDLDFDLRFANERGVRLCQIVTAAKQRFTYEYDFGDGWIHDIVVESVGPAAAPATYPKFIDGRNACPPDDVGGPPGYDAFLESVGDPTHEDHARMVEWAGGRFNPLAFDVTGTEAAFERLAAAQAKRGTSTR